MEYRIYGIEKGVGWRLIEVVYTEQDAEILMNIVNNDKKYETILVVEHNIKLDEDTPYIRKIDRK